MDPQKSADTVRETQAELDGEQDKPVSQFDGYDLTAPSELDLGQPDSDQQNPVHTSGQITWEASEYIHHEKNMGWFLILGAVTLVLAAAMFFLRQWTFGGLIIVMGVVLAVYGRRPPRVLHYSIGNEGLSIENKHYTFEDFRAFGILEEGPIYSALLFPRKRFSPAVTMYFSQDDGEKIVDVLGAHLPMEHVELEFIDKLARTLRF